MAARKKKSAKAFSDFIRQKSGSMVTRSELDRLKKMFEGSQGKTGKRGSKIKKPLKKVMRRKKR